MLLLKINRMNYWIIIQISREAYYAEDCFGSLFLPRYFILKKKKITIWKKKITNTKQSARCLKVDTHLHKKDNIWISPLKNECTWGKSTLDNETKFPVWIILSIDRPIDVVFLSIIFFICITIWIPWWQEGIFEGQK